MRFNRLSSASRQKASPSALLRIGLAIQKNALAARSALKKSGKSAGKNSSEMDKRAANLESLYRQESKLRQEIPSRRQRDEAAEFPFHNEAIPAVVAQARAELPTVLESEAARDSSAIIDAVDCFRAHLPERIAQIKLRGFCDRWQAKIAKCEASHLEMHVPCARTWIDRLLGREPLYRISLVLNAPKHADDPWTLVRSRISVTGCRPKRAQSHINKASALIFESLRSFLQPCRDRRESERVPYAHPVGVFPALPRLEPRREITCCGLDLSQNGMKLWSPTEVDASHMGIILHAPHVPEPLHILGRVQRVSRLPDGGYEIGVSFQPPPHGVSESR